MLRIIVGIVALAGIAGYAEDRDQAIRRQLFEKVFGDAVRLNPAIHKQVLDATPGVRHYFDTDNNGQPDEVWFIDNALRHPDEYKPLLVRAIDEDGDLRTNGEPDLDSDLYVADWHADGSVDAVLDYTDSDGDGDLDEMGMYFYGGTSGYFDEPVLRVWWSRDIGDDNLLWHDIAYSYDQALCQFRTHFGGDEELVAFSLPLSGTQWIPFFENPFLFYDRDGDGVTEEVLRMSGIGNDVECIRHSFDADNDAVWDEPRDFDVSLTAWAVGAHWTKTGEGRGRSELQFPNRLAEITMLRGIPTTPFLKHETAREFARPILWERMMLTWDEIDWNVDRQTFADSEERWEGVIAAGNDDFPQVGGPSCGELNKRYELVLHPDEPVWLYYHPTDRRLHLQNADKAWMVVDLNLDKTPEMRYDMFDTDNDGRIDAWTIDVDLDGKPDDRWECGEIVPLPVGWNWAEINGVVQVSREENILDSFALHQRLMEALRLQQISVDGVALYDILSERSNCDNPNSKLPDVFREKLYRSEESLFYYTTVLNDAAIARLKKEYTNRSFWVDFNQSRSVGDWLGMAQQLAREFKLSEPLRIPDRKALSMQCATIERPLVAWAEDWVPPNIGWESEKIAYRMYWGQFDFFGKKQDRLIYESIGAQSYHDETDWGIDALNTGNSGGCGGVTLFVNDVHYPVRNPQGHGDLVFTKRFLSKDNRQVEIEVMAAGVGPTDAPFTVRFHCKAFAGRKDTEIEILVQGGRDSDRLQLGIGLTKLPQESMVLDSGAGVMGNWGVQTPVIGFIGMGIVFPAERFKRVVTMPDEHLVVVELQRNEPFKYRIQCDWLRGRRFDRSPSPADWLNELKALSAKVR